MGGKHYLRPAEEKSGLGVVAAAAVFMLLTSGICLLALRPAARIAACLVLGGVLAVLLLVAERLGRARGRHFFAHVVFPVVLGGMSLAYLLFFPPSTVPDETYHYGKAYAYANVLTPGMGTFDMRKEDFEFTRWSRVYDKAVDRDFWEMAGDLSLAATYEGTVLEHTILGEINLGTNPPQLRLPAALGIVLGRALNLSGVATYYLGRLCNLLYGVALIVLAVRLSPVGKNAMIAVALLPMTLHLLGSYSYDVGILGLTFVLLALLLRLLVGEGRAATWELVATEVAVFLAAPGKAVYAFVAVLGLFVPRERFSSRRMAMAFKASLLMMPLVVGVAGRLVSQFLSNGLSTGEGSSLQSRQGEQGRYYSVGEVLAHPLSSAQIVLRTYFDNADFYVSTLVGGRLGWFQRNIFASNWVVLLLWLCLLASALPAPDDDHVFGGRLRLALLGTFVFVLLLITASMFISYTFVGEIKVAGIQGRYFLPVMPCVLLAMRGRAVRASVGLAPPLVLSLCGINCVYLATICFNALGGALA